jgi:hypothetical protein
LNPESSFENHSTSSPCKLLFAKNIMQLTYSSFEFFKSFKNYLDKVFLVLAVASANDLLWFLELLDNPFNISLTEI